MLTMQYSGTGLIDSVGILREKIRQIYILPCSNSTDSFCRYWGIINDEKPLDCGNEIPLLALGLQ
jgi:hypothetical protein